MKWMNDYDLFLFDFDGLLVNSEPVHYQAYVNLCEKFQEHLSWGFEEFCHMAHTDAYNIRKNFQDRFPKMIEQAGGWKALYEIKKREYLHLLQDAKIELMQGVEPILEKLKEKNISRCVVTNSPLEQVQMIRARIKPLQSIPYWITREDYEKPKPDPECYEMAIRLYGKGAKKIIGFEDSFRGLRALMGTNAQPVLICSSDHPQMQAEIDSKVLYFSSFAKIPDILL